MAKRKAKRNAGTLQARYGFKIRREPVVHLAEEGSLADARNRFGLTRLHGLPFLFAIARDARTIFASWNIDWRSAFEHAMPADRKVHLRVIGGDGIIETTVAVEPTRPMQYLAISSLHGSYQVEIGYFQPFDTWHSVASSQEIKMPLQESVGLGDVDLATIPFHLNFQQLAKLFRTPANAPIARVVSGFQKRVLSSGKSNRISRSEAQALRNLNLSLSEIAAAQRDFQNVYPKTLTRRVSQWSQLAATSPARGFEARAAQVKPLA